VRRSSLFSWALLALWSTWLHALQGQWAAGSSWAPDLGMVLMVVLAARMPSGELATAAVAVALGRVAVTIDPPAAVLVGLLVPALVFGGLRSVVVIREGLARSLLAGLGSAALVLWLSYVHEARQGGAVLWYQPDLAPPLARTALSTAAVALLLGPLFTLLPGVPGLIRRRPWEVAASGR
jgi:hypothetical protein